MLAAVPLDPRIEPYARLLVERCVAVRPGWQVVVLSTPAARPLVERVCELIGERGAYALLRLDFESAHLPVTHAWTRAAPEALLGGLAPADLHTVESIDARITIDAPENTRGGGSDLSPERRALVRQATRPYYARSMSMDIAWVGCQYPTPALAQDAGMTLTQFEDFLFSACLLDWDAEGAKMRRIADRFEQASEVRIVGEGTDLRLSIEGRPAQIDDGHLNMPGGEIFFAPVEDSAEGVVTYSEFPAVYGSGEASGVRLRFEGGRIVDAAADSGEEFLTSTLDTDDGARRLGELGIGCNPGITRHMKNVLFDEKMYGTVHLAVGASYEFAGGKNVSSVHWDMVKDVRSGGRLFLDGELVQRDGTWLF
jgi:aminopeptidase